MKTTTELVRVVGREEGGFWGVYPSVAVGVVAAVLVWHVAVEGMWGLEGERLPAAVAGMSAWLVAGVGMNAGRWRGVLGSLLFAVVLFGGAVAALGATVSAAAPWFLALGGWVVVCRRDIGHPLVAMAWASFNLAMGTGLWLSP